MGDEPQNGTPGLPGEVFGRQVRLVRSGLRLSQADLALRLKEIGYTQTEHGKPATAAVTRIETGKRQVSIDDALAISAVLNVNPAHLLSGTFTGEPVMLASTLTVSAEQMLDWFRDRGTVGPNLERFHVHAPSRLDRDARDYPTVAHMLRMVDTLIDAAAAKDHARMIDAWEAIRLNAKIAKEDLERTSR